MWETTCSVSASAVGRNAIPTAYCPAGGRAKSTTALRKRSGIWIVMPAPSPVFASAPCAPRCSRLQRAPMPIATISWVARPLMSTTNETPHASCSLAGSYRPKALGRSPDQGVFSSGRESRVITVHPHHSFGVTQHGGTALARAAVPSRIVRGAVASPDLASARGAPVSPRRPGRASRSRPSPLRSGSGCR